MGVSIFTYVFILYTCLSTRTRDNMCGYLSVPVSSVCEMVHVSTSVSVCPGIFDNVCMGVRFMCACVEFLL